MREAATGTEVLEALETLEEEDEERLYEVVQMKSI